MRKRSLSRRERDMVEEAVTRVCLALGADEKDEDIRQAAWAEILAVYREDPGRVLGRRPAGLVAGLRSGGGRHSGGTARPPASGVWPDFPGQAGERGYGGHSTAVAPLPCRKF